MSGIHAGKRDSFYRYLEFRGIDVGSGQCINISEHELKVGIIRRHYLVFFKDPQTGDGPDFAGRIHRGSSGIAFIGYDGGVRRT